MAGLQLLSLIVLLNVGVYAQAATEECLDSLTGCECMRMWTYAGQIYSGCANPDNNPNGAWCFVDTAKTPCPSAQNGRDFCSNDCQQKSDLCGAEISEYGNADDGFCACSSCSLGFVETELLINTTDCSDAASIQCDVVALLAFKNGLKDGEEKFTNWDGSDPCKWQFVTCENVGKKQKRVVALEVEGEAYKLDGYLPGDFSVMKFLKRFSLWNEGEGELIYGNLPAEFSELLDLEEIKISQNQLTGTLHKEWSTLTNLSRFWAWQNKFSGSLPVEFSTWVNMQEFQVYDTRINGTIPEEYSTWDQMQILSLGGNALEGKLPESITAWKDLKVLEMAENRMTGQLKQEYSVFSNLTQYILENNYFTGTLPVEYSEFSDISNFNIAFNMLTGNLPIEFSEWTEIQSLRISSNDFQGFFPEEWSTLLKLSSFYAADNELCAPLPVWLDPYEVEYFSDNGDFEDVIFGTQGC
eukprot:TRINITY_DN17057_c0_g1_i2.p1 TRINITY_DN17057_c0_g1~~TRINITY_DN17057_c0_g1_i2.p1  ORF type:complete len:469 (-),score=77.34 TRINITY_DN17057_c0_g1_i2:412-1818(-)